MAETEKNNAAVAALEALLFAYGEPMSVKKIGALLGESADAVTRAADALRQKLEAASDGGLCLLVNAGQYQLATKPSFASLVESLMKAETQEELTPASQETLAIVAFGGPIGRAEIEYIRGVNSSFILRSLLLRGLVDRAPDPERANAYRYTISFDCLKHLGVGSISGLPDYEKYRGLIEKFRAPQTSV